MTDLDAYRVEPEDTAPPEPVQRDDSPIVLTEGQKLNVGGLGWWSIAVFLLFAFLGGFLCDRLIKLAGIGLNKDEGETLFILVVITSVVGTILVAYKVHRYLLRGLERTLFQKRAAGYEQEARKREHEYKAEVARKEKEAQALTQQLRSLLRSSVETRATVSNSLGQAERAVKEAEKEFAENAFDPYWDAVEAAAETLTAYDSGVRQLSQNARDYYELLKGRRHNFPSMFPIQIESLPEPRPVAAEFRRVLRLGQTNFEFTNIWKHRHLSDALNNLGRTIERSFTNLESSIAAGLSLSSDEQARTREVLAEESGRTRATIDARADEQRRLAETQVRLLRDLQD